MFARDQPERPWQLDLDVHKFSAQGTETELGQDKGKLMPLIVICEHPSPIAKVWALMPTVLGAQ
jgi:hypothetical protein